jgi:hypothetical protein
MPCKASKRPWAASTMGRGKRPLLTCVFEGVLGSVRRFAETACKETERGVLQNKGLHTR